MTALDISLLLLMGINGIIGFRRGLLAEVLSMVALALAIMAVRLFHAPVASLLTGVVGTEGGAATLAFAVVFGLTWYLGKFLARSVSSSARDSLLGPIDRVLGFGFGALKGLLIATVAFVGFLILYDTLYGADALRPEWMRHSRTYPLLNASGKAMSQWLAERRAHGGVIGEDGSNESAPDNGADGETDGDTAI